MNISGIGARVAPTKICQEMVLIGEWCLANGHIINSGHCGGPDYAFEIGAQKNCRVFLPWPTFNSNLPMLGSPIIPPNNATAEALVDKFHPNPKALSSGGRALMRRNAYQVLGPNLNEPVDAVVCWRNKPGGTDQALRIAKAHNIPIFNMNLPEYSTAALVIKALKGLLCALPKQT